MNVLDYFNAMAPHIQGKAISELYPAELTSKLDFAKVQPGACLICGDQMDYYEMYPQDKITPRATHAKCWHELISVQHSDCLVCGGRLDDFQVMAQRKFHGDLHHHIHETGECAFYFSLCSAKVLGLETGIREERSVAVQHGSAFKQLPAGIRHHDDGREVLAPPQIAYEPVETVDDIIEMQQVRKPEPAYVRR